MTDTIYKAINRICNAYSELVNYLSRNTPQQADFKKIELSSYNLDLIKSIVDALPREYRDWLYIHCSVDFESSQTGKSSLLYRVAHENPQQLIYFLTKIPPDKILGVLSDKGEQGNSIVSLFDKDASSMTVFSKLASTKSVPQSKQTEPSRVMFGFINNSNKLNNKSYEKS
ncbi:hypothetical protein L3V83_08150 [Thiotrichales bacterium 19X7-9]|nr:hypothetical protein [Thiotrichales bacterium 19X7-9]